MVLGGVRDDRQRDRQGLLVSLVLLVVITATFPLYAGLAARPLTIFAVPPLLTAVICRWRPTVIAATMSVLVAAAIGLTGTLTAPALVARLVIIAIASGLGAVGAALRERQQRRIDVLDETTTTLQSFEGALEPHLVPPEGFVVAARYVPADKNMKLGGDFLDVAPLGDGRLGFVIGDVSGHGPRAAALGAAVRAGWRAIVFEGGDDPADWVRRLNAAFFDARSLSLFITLCTGFVDPAGGELCLVNAGHPAPVTLGRPPRLVPVPAGRPLGLGDANWTVTCSRWFGDPLLFYTDGLVENPLLDGDPERWNEDGLLAWLGREPAPGDDLGALADRLVAAGTVGRDVRDDVAVLIVGR